MEIRPSFMVKLSTEKKGETNPTAYKIEQSCQAY